MPSILNGPEVYQVLQKSLDVGPQARDVVTHINRQLAMADVMAANGDDHGAARPMLHRTLRYRHGSYAPGDAHSIITYGILTNGCVVSQILK